MIDYIQPVSSLREPTS